MSQQVLDIASAELNCARPGSSGIGVMFLAFFSTWWMASGLNSLCGLTWAMLSVVVFAGLVLFLAGWRRARREDSSLDAHGARVFRNVNLVQWGACIALVVVLNVVQHAEWITPGIMLIVALHFFPLAKLFRSKLHVVLGAALTALAVSYPFLTAAGPSSGVGPVAAGIILWAAAAGRLFVVARR